MVKTSTFIYLYSNFEDSEVLTENLFDEELNKLSKMLSFLEENTKKIPDKKVEEIIEFAKNYS